PDFIFSWRKQEDTQCLREVFEKLLRTPANDDTVATLRGMLNYASRNVENGLTVYKIQFGRVDAALITSAEKGFEKAVIERISSLLSIFHQGFRASGESRDLFG